MEEAYYYRDQAKRARRLARGSTNRQVTELLERVATDYDNLAADLENHAIDIRHPERMPQRGG